MGRDAIAFGRVWQRLRLTDTSGLVTVGMERPDERNAFDPLMMQELTEVARLLRRHPTTRAVILTGQDRYFSAGADLSSTRARNASDQTLLDLRAAVAAGPDLCHAWEDIEAITIVAIEGYCVGGACALALACDFRVMAENAMLRLPEVPLGMNMSWRTLPRLQALIGPARAKQFVLFGEPRSASDCLTWGMADEVCPDGTALACANRWAAKVAALPPIPVRMTKEAINAAAYVNAQSVSIMDRDQYLLTARSSDFREGVAAFLEKRSPAFRGD